MAENIGNINFTIDNKNVYLWQYDNAVNLKGILDNNDNFVTVNVSNFWSDFFTNVFNIKTANTFGLEIWGEILGVARPSYVSNGETIVFNDDMYRKLLLGRMLKFNSNGSVKDINDYLQFIFNDKLVFAVDNYNMSMKVLLYYNASDEDLAIINSAGFLPLPVGVKVTYSVVPPEETFGFYGSGLTGFDTGTFFEGY
jgi:hypothetical protein